MSVVSLFLVLSLFMGMVGKREPSDDTEPVQQVRRAIEKSLPYFENEMRQWNQRQNCVSCHSALPIIWTLNSARERAFPVRRDLLQDWTRKSLQWNRKVPDESIAYLLLGRNRQLSDPELAPYLEYANRLLKQQRRTGAWKKGGQQILQRRREKNSSIESTMWVLWALSSVSGAGQAFTDSRGRALEWLKEQSPTTTESLALQLLLASTITENPRAVELAKRLLSRQNSDGGWGWSQNQVSDVISTGQSLYALGMSGTTNDLKRIQNAWKYLVQAQDEAGSWHVSMPVDGWSDEHREQSVYWGTAWAILGLTHSLPK